MKKVEKLGWRLPKSYSPVYASLSRANLEDPFVVTGANPFPMSPVTVPTERIDCIWLRGVMPQRAWVSDSSASDHRMIVVKVQLERQDAGKRRSIGH